MTFTRSFRNYRPPKRFDENPYTIAKIQESEDGETWTTIEAKSLNPQDEDPAKPQLRNFTTTAATLEAGWYRILWEDAVGSQFASEPVSFQIITGIAWRPSVEDVATLLRARTYEANSSEAGTFTDDTRPTDDEVERLIDQAVADIAGRIGYEIPTETVEQARRATALRTALLIELSYWPEQGIDASPFLQFGVLQTETTDRLVSAVQIRDLFGETVEQE